MFNPVPSILDPDAALGRMVLDPLDATSKLFRGHAVGASKEVVDSVADVGEGRGAHCIAFQLAVCVLYAPIIIIYRQSCQIKLDVFPIFVQMMQKQQNANRVIDHPFEQVATVAQYTPNPS